MELYKALKSGIVEVKFTKVNGDIRTMPCTLKPDLIPEWKESTHVGPEDVMRVYCTDAEGWRSFRKESVIEWHPL
jgi:hypothetical protein